MKTSDLVLLCGGILLFLWMDMKPTSDMKETMYGGGQQHMSKQNCVRPVEDNFNPQYLWSPPREQSR